MCISLLQMVRKSAAVMPVFALSTTHSKCRRKTQSGPEVQKVECGKYTIYLLVTWNSHFRFKFSGPCSSFSDLHFCKLREVMVFHVYPVVTKTKSFTSLQRCYHCH